MSKAIESAELGDTYPMAKMFFSVYVCIDKCAELETKLNLSRPAKIKKRRRSEFIPIAPATKRQCSHSESQSRQEYGDCSHHFEDDEFNLVYDGLSEASKCKCSIHPDSSKKIASVVKI